MLGSTRRNPWATDRTEQRGRCSTRPAVRDTLRNIARRVNHAESTSLASCIPTVRSNELVEDAHLNGNQHAILHWSSNRPIEMRVERLTVEIRLRTVCRCPFRAGRFSSTTTLIEGDLAVLGRRVPLESHGRTTSSEREANTPTHSCIRTTKPLREKINRTLIG